MKCKRIIKVVSALALTVALLVSTGVVSFAASYTTTTKYLNEGTIEVTSVATGLDVGEMATYVAYNGNGFSEANAVYIDQATADETKSVTFTYQADSDDVKAKVLFGGKGSTTAPEEVGLAISVVVNEGEPKDVVVPEVDAAYTDSYLAREFAIVIPAGEAVKSVSFKGEELDAWYVKNGAVVVMDVISEDGTLEITTEEAEASVTIGTVEAVAGNLTAFAKAVCDDGVEFGIIIADGENAVLSNPVEFNVADDYTTAVKLPAAGKGADGVFAVAVEDDAALDAGTYTVAAYAGEAMDVTSVTIE